MTSSRLLSFQGGDLSTFWLLSRNQIAETKRLVPSGKHMSVHTYGKETSGAQSHAVPPRFSPAVYQRDFLGTLNASESVSSKRKHGLQSLTYGKVEAHNVKRMDQSYGQQAAEPEWKPSAWTPSAVSFQYNIRSLRQPNICEASHDVEIGEMEEKASVLGHYLPLVPSTEPLCTYLLSYCEPPQVPFVVHEALQIHWLLEAPGYMMGNPRPSEI
ncbi:uncharacterized protein LOC117803820 [Ailuropoda melanoleuca]|uniref:uncharacterized protein LOC117803820 n=1 Tax=Ailuropoda melanoleuca TaxID=9646 RepID=UPI001494A62C|nr:uncharacterized protein LOC117803820 [Ailuropoda melanoleuca]